MMEVTCSIDSYISYDSDGNGVIHKNRPYWDDSVWVPRGATFTFSSNTARRGQLWLFSAGEDTYTMVEDRLRIIDNGAYAPAYKVVHKLGDLERLG